MTCKQDLEVAESKLASIALEYESVAQAFITKKQKYKQDIT